MSNLCSVHLHCCRLSSEAIGWAWPMRILMLNCLLTSRFRRVRLALRERFKPGVSFGVLLRLVED